MAKDKLVTQVDLVSAGRQMTTWLDNDARIRVGVVISLKGEDDTRWKIVKVYETRTAADIDKRGWDNNNYDKHEGLFK